MECLVGEADWLDGVYEDIEGNATQAGEESLIAKGGAGLETEVAPVVTW